MSAARPFHLWLAIGLLIIVAGGAQAEVVEYTLENVILDDGGLPMHGTFSWTYDVGDFENGVGQFSYLEIPYTNHDHTDLESVIDVGSSIEITLEDSVHDDGVDITLFLLEPLTPTAGSAIDLERSAFEIGGNGFHTGVFLSGSVAPAGPTGVGDAAEAPELATELTAFPNPFNPTTTLAFDLPQPAIVQITICDASGRVVRTLSVGEYRDAGRLRTSWQGRDDAGRSVPSGMYFARVQAGDRVLLRKLSLLK